MCVFGVDDGICEPFDVGVTNELTFRSRLFLFVY